MGLIARGNDGGTFTPVPPGMHLARCYRVVDLGTQTSEYLGQVKSLPKIMIQFEVHSEDDNGKPLVTPKGEPMSISKNFTLSLKEMATLRKDLVSWRGREFTSQELDGFELKNILGAWAYLSIAKATGMNGKEYTNIMSINPVPPALKKNGLPNGHNQTAIFSLDEPDMEMFETFSDNLKAKIKSSPEWKRWDYESGEMQSGADREARKGSGFDDMSDDIPF